MRTQILFDDSTVFGVSFGENVPLLDDALTCEVLRFARSGEIGICFKRSAVFRDYSPKLKKHTDAASLERELLSPTVPNSPKDNSPFEGCTESSRDNKVEATDHHYSPKLTLEVQNPFDLADENIVARDGKLIDQRTGECVGRCKNADNMRRSWNSKRYEILNSLLWNCSCLVTATLDGEPTFEMISKLASKFVRWIGNKFPNDYVCAFVFVEPHQDGCWHVHIIVGFLDCIPKDFAEKTRKWWDKYNGKPCDEQVDVTPFKSRKHLEWTIRYLNPTSSKKKSRLKFYPLNSKPMRGFGNFSAPNKALAPFAIGQAIAGKEMTELRRQVTVSDPQTETELFFKSEFFFEPKSHSTTVVEPTHEYIYQSSDLQDRFACHLDCADCHCSECEHNGQCDDCLGTICGNLCADCVRNADNIHTFRSFVETVTEHIPPQDESANMPEEVHRLKVSHDREWCASRNCLLCRNLRGCDDFFIASTFSR